MPSFILSDNLAPWLLQNVAPHCLPVTSLWTQLGTSESKLGLCSVDKLLHRADFSKG